MPDLSPHPSKTFVKAPPLTTEKYTAGLSVRAKAEKLHEIREWCRAAGHTVPDRGKIPQAALAAYDANAESLARHAGVRRVLLEQETVASLAIDRAADAQTVVIGEVTVGEPVTPAEFSEALDQVRERVDAPDPEPLRAADHAAAFDVPVEFPERPDVVGERDRARALATRLEEELARAEADRDRALAGMAFLLGRLETERSARLGERARLEDRILSLSGRLSATEFQLHVARATVEVSKLTDALAAMPQRRSWWRRVLG